MNDRIRRMHRIAELVDQQEQRARRAVGTAMQEREAAAQALQSVFLQCREVARQPDEFGVAFRRGLIEAGFLAERSRRSALESAVEVADQRLAEWHDQRTRVDALDRLIGRLHEAEAEDVARRIDGELGDLISARSMPTSSADRIEEVA